MDERESESRWGGMGGGGRVGLDPRGLRRMAGWWLAGWDDERWTLTELSAVKWFATCQKTMGNRVGIGHLVSNRKIGLHYSIVCFLLRCPLQNLH